MFEKFEEKFEVIFPENNNATYESILNYSTELDNPFQRWYRYKEGFSVQFVEKVVEEYAESDIEFLIFLYYLSISKESDYETYGFYTSFIVCKCG